jgi:hypothetical protein
MMNVRYVETCSDCQVLGSLVLGLELREVRDKVVIAM